MTHPWPFDIIGPELPSPKDYKQSECPNVSLVGEEKLDGRRLLIVKTPDGAFGYGRHPSSVTGTFEPIAVDLSPITSLWPVWTAVDGELFCPGRPAAYVATAIANAEDLEYLAFAMPFYNGRDLRESAYAENRAELLSLEIDCVAIQGTWTSPPPEQDVHELCRNRKPPLEGLVLKQIDQPYGRSWYRCKEVHTVDCIVLAIKAGQGKYKGMVGALRCGLYTGNGNEIIEVCAASGMTDEERARMSARDIGRIVEIEYQQVDAKGRLRFPRFLRFRDDKQLRGCDIFQLHAGERPRFPKCAGCSDLYKCWDSVLQQRKFECTKGEKR